MPCHLSLNILYIIEYGFWHLLMRWSRIIPACHIIRMYQTTRYYNLCQTNRKHYIRKCRFHLIGDEMVKKTVKKIVLLGESAVGKTSLIKRYVHDEFADDYISTIGTKVSKKVINLNVEGQEIEVNLMIWDMLGREGYMSTQARQIVGAQGVIIVGDVTRPETMINIEKYWIPMILRTVGTVKLPFIFLGNKIDLADDDSLMNTLDISL